MKTKTKAEKNHLSAVASLGCIVCRKFFFAETPAEVHHITTHTGMGKKASHFETIPLCHKHHRTGGHGVALHAGVQTWEAKFGKQTDLLKETLQDVRMLENGL